MVIFVGAMDVEVQAICRLCEDVEEKTLRGIKIYEATMKGKEVVIATSGIGKVNAAMTTAVLLQEYEVEYVVNIGSAGGLKKEQNVGDIVISEWLTMHDFEIGQEWGKDERFNVYADVNLLERAERVLEESAIPCWRGLILSGDQFITGAEKFTTIVSRFPEAQAVEMEGYALAKVCTQFGVPFIVLRALSDIVFKEENAVDFEKFVAFASERSAKFCEKFIVE